MDYQGRRERLRAVLEKNGLDVLLITHLPNVRYLCGFTGSAGALLVSEEGSTFFTDGRYTVQARTEIQSAKIVIARKSPIVAAAERFSAQTKKRMRFGLEAEHMTVADRSRLHAIVGRKATLRPAPPLVEKLRVVKDQEEIAFIRAAVMVGAGLFDVALKTIRPGTKETQVAAEMEYAARQRGAEGMSFETIIASGRRSALPHGRASEATIPTSGFVVCDFGVILTGYCSDMTRTVHVGRIKSDARKMYEAVREAQQLAIETVRPGVSVAAVDHAARKLLHRKHFGGYFTHSTGHGVGLEIHEPPRIAKGMTDVLQPGMVITVEPGAYIPAVGGVRIEDMVVVTESGAEVLTPTSKELITI